MKKGRFNEVSIEFIGPLRKYLRVIRGTKPWNANYYACIDHEKISPLYKEWLCYPEGKYNKEFPRLVNIILGSDDLVESRYSSGCEFGGETERLALNMAKSELSKIKPYSDFKILVVNERNFRYFLSEDAQIFARTFILYFEDGVTLDFALSDSEEHFGKTIMRRDFFISLAKDIPSIYQKRCDP